MAVVPTTVRVTAAPAETEVCVSPVVGVTYFTYKQVMSSVTVTFDCFRARAGHVRGLTKSRLREKSPSVRWYVLRGLRRHRVGTARPCVHATRLITTESSATYSA